MKLYLNKNVESHMEIKQRMDDMRLAYETEEVKLSEITLEDGKEKYAGVQATIEHLDEIAGELHQWYYCNC